MLLTNIWHRCLTYNKNPGFAQYNSQTWIIMLGHTLQNLHGFLLLTPPVFFLTYPLLALRFFLFERPKG